MMTYFSAATNFNPYLVISLRTASLAFNSSFPSGGGLDVTIGIQLHGEPAESWQVFGASGWHSVCHHRLACCRPQQQGLWGQECQVPTKSSPQLFDLLPYPRCAINMYVCVYMYSIHKHMYIHIMILLYWYMCICKLSIFQWPLLCALKAATNPSNLA